MINSIFRSFRAYTQAFQIISKLKLWAYALVPAIISLLLAIGIFSTAYGLADDIGRIIIGWYPWEWGAGVIEKIASVTGGLLIAILGLLVYKNLIVVLAGPFMSPLSEKVEKYLTGDTSKTKISVPGMVKDFFRGLSIAIRNLFWELLFTVVLLLLGLIPIFAPFTTAAIFIVQSYYAGFGNFDFFLERHFSVSQSVAFMKNNRWSAIGNGVVFLGLLITVVGVLVAPVLGTIAATIEGVEKLNKGSINLQRPLEKELV
ncbi:MAG: EI24 domain-containing protein [Saprospiraceae bacterium]|nr:EI24 domain-containing protein [Saprospiraceae bacterium]